MTQESSALTPSSIIHFDPELRSDAAIKLFLGKMLDNIENNETGIRNKTNTKSLHDFRVACRRCRSIIGQLKQVIPKHTSERLQCNLAWLNKATGPGRDMDVYLLRFPEYQDNLPDQLREKLEPLHTFLLSKKIEEYKNIVRILDSNRYINFKEFMRDYSNTSFTTRSTLPRARLPISENCNERIWRIFRRASKEGSGISKHSPDEALHELRKTCKKLRYLLEFCHCLYKERDISRIIRELKLLQDNLGEFHDYGVEINTLKNFLHKIENDKSDYQNTILAITHLVEYLDKKKHDARKAYKKTFKQFSSEKNKGIFKRLFKSETC